MEIKKLKEQVGNSSNSFYPLTSKDAVVGLTNLVDSKINEAKGELESYVNGKVPENIEISVCEDCIEDLNAEEGEYAFDVLEKSLYVKTGDNWVLKPKGDSNVYVKRNLIIRLFRVFFDKDINSYSSWERGEHAGVVEDDKNVYKICIKGGSNPEFKEVTPSVGDIFVVDVPGEELKLYVLTNSGLVSIKEEKKKSDIYIKGILDTKDYSKLEEVLNDNNPCYVLFDDESEVNHRHLNYVDSNNLDSGFPIPYASIKTVSVNKSEKEGSYKEDYEKYDDTSIILGKDVERLSLGKKTNNVNVFDFSGNTDYLNKEYRYNEDNSTFGIKSDNVWKDYASLDIYKVNSRETSEESNSKLIALYKESLNKTIISYIEDFLIMKYRTLDGYYYVNPDIYAIVTSTIDWHDVYELQELNSFIKSRIPSQENFIYFQVDNTHSNIIKAYVLRHTIAGSNDHIEKKSDFNEQSGEDIYNIYHVLFKTSLSAQPPTTTMVPRPQGIYVDINYSPGKKYYRLNRNSDDYFDQIEEEPINDLLQ